MHVGRFREGLYHRLFSIRIRTPALREHPEDIPELAQHFWQKVHKDDSRSHPLPLPNEITAELAAYPWPGNARELRAFPMNVTMLTNGRPATLPLVRAVMDDRRGLMPTRHDPVVDRTEEADG